MRRLRSSFTLLSDQPPQEELYAESYSSQEAQFTWAELFSAESPPYPSNNPSDFYLSTHSGFTDFINPQPDDFYPSFASQHQYPNYSAWNEICGDGRSVDILPADNEESYGEIDASDHPLHSYPVATPYGTVSLLMRHLIRVDISPEGGLFVQNCCSRSTAALSGGGAPDRSCVVHSNSRVYQDCLEAHVVTCQGRLAKICQRGVVFAASTRGLAYLVDASGTKSTADRFADLRGDFSGDVFGCCETAGAVARCHELVAGAMYKPSGNGDDLWVVGPTLVKQDRYGNIEVSQDRRQRAVTVLPTVDEISVRTPLVSVTVGSYSKRYLSLQMGSMRITSGFCGLTAQNGSQKAGIDRNGKVAIL